MSQDHLVDKKASGRNSSKLVNEKQEILQINHRKVQAVNETSLLEIAQIEATLLGTTLLGIIQLRTRLLRKTHFATPYNVVIAKVKVYLKQRKKRIKENRRVMPSCELKPREPWHLQNGPQTLAILLIADGA